MADFTLSRYRRLLTALIGAGYRFQPYSGYLTGPAERVVILRHDVDKRAANALATAQIEHEMGIAGTYYFRILPCSFDAAIIKEIARLGHETGYHYEDVALVGRDRRFSSEQQLAELAIESFCNNLAAMRALVPVETICMHGSPLSRYDNTLLWRYYDYRHYGIIGEPYLDTPFERVQYLTDTGRTWNNRKISVRDKVSTSHGTYRTTLDIIRAAEENSLSPQLMLTIHPQRWTNSSGLWIYELLAQRAKNQIKRIIAKR